MVRSSARAKPFVGSLLSFGAGWPASLPDSWIPRPTFRNRSPAMFTVIGSSVMIGPGLVVVVVDTPDAAAALAPPDSTNPFRPPRSPMARTAPMASVLPLPPLASSPSAVAFFFAISRSSGGRGSAGPGPGSGCGVDLADRRVAARGDVIQGGGHVGQHDELHPPVGRPSLRGVVGGHRALVGVAGGLEAGRGDPVPFDQLPEHGRGPGRRQFPV